MLFSGVAHATAIAGELQPVLRERYVRIILDGLRPDDADRAARPPARLRAAAAHEATPREVTRDEPSTAVAPNPRTSIPRRWVTLARRDHRRVHRGARQHRAERRDPDDPARLPHHAAVARSGSITGYALTFATLLIIGGRLGDIYGHRRIFIIGAGAVRRRLVPRVGLDVGAAARSLGEAIIEGIGASLMLPATLAILSTTFQGRERATAFAAWGATAGVAAAFGPRRRRLPHHELLVALVVPHQRDHRPARDHRRARCS